jgi:hypothetical protein
MSAHSERIIDFITKVAIVEDNVTLCKYLME